MNKVIKDIIYNRDMDDLNSIEKELLTNDIDHLVSKAFGEESSDESLLEIHRILYILNISHIIEPWKKNPKNINHPKISRIKFLIEESWEKVERIKHADVMKELPSTSNFPKWINNYIDNHPKNFIHPIFPFLRDEASYDQLKEFFIQETPLEMLFGDIIALMMPGTYGEPKMEMAQNFWDEVGHANDSDVHRNLRGYMMNHLDIPTSFYVDDYQIFIREELELINLYLSSATNRSKCTQLVGGLLATELMIPNRFQYSIDGWKRVGMSVENMRYLLDHISIDAIHAEDWLDHVTMPILNENASQMGDIVFGVLRRMETAGAVVDKLYERLLSNEFTVFN